jgi:hypothetical protein
MHPGCAPIMRCGPAVIRSAAGSETSLLKGRNHGLPIGIDIGFDLRLVLATAVSKRIATLNIITYTMQEVDIGCVVSQLVAGWQ